MNTASLITCIVGAAALLATSAVAQNRPRTPEGPGDIVALREVPYQNAIQVGEPGRPVLVNPITLMGDVNPFSSAVGDVRIWPLEDGAAANIVGSPSGRFASIALPGESLSAFGGNASSTGANPLTSSTSSGVGGVGGLVTGTVASATSSLRGVFDGAFSRGGG